MRCSMVARYCCWGPMTLPGLHVYILQLHKDVDEYVYTHSMYTAGQMYTSKKKKVDKYVYI